MDDNCLVEYPPHDWLDLVCPALASVIWTWHRYIRHFVSFEVKSASVEENDCDEFFREDRPMSCVCDFKKSCH